MTSHTRLAVLLVAALALAAGCGVDNSNGMDCHENDCAASCAEKGYPTGTCVDNVCTCSGLDGGPYGWNTGSETGTDTDTDTDTGTGIDAGIDAGVDAGIDAGPDAGLDAGK
ncbi:MAG: hypothetical protein PHU25_20295 [Deltaproteobacteria bacterium]|nr:hypothetical protein [Deltaproteobacteria bacterium]